MSSDNLRRSLGKVIPHQRARRFDLWSLTHVQRVTDRGAQNRVVWSEDRTQEVGDGPVTFSPLDVAGLRDGDAFTHDEREGSCCAARVGE